jgi:hypothetical protein
MQAKNADTNAAADFFICLSGDGTQRFTLPFSVRIWVAMSRNSGVVGA